jgi:hypothetical protein
MQQFKILDCLEDGRWGLHDHDPEPKTSSTLEVWLLLEHLFLLIPISMGEFAPTFEAVSQKHYFECLFWAASKMENMFLREKHVVQKYVGFCRQLKRMSRS